MERIITLMIIGMFVLVGFATVAMAEPDDPVTPNQAPKAPVILVDKSTWEKQEYKFCFYAVDPDGDDIYFDISFTKAGDENLIACEPDDPVTPWYGPFESGEEIDESRMCHEEGKYELTIRAKDSYGNIGPSTTITVTYTKAKIIQLPIINRILERFPGLLFIVTKIFKI
ncbi:MAG: hypothetical protein JSV67_03505 [Thermoplasmatales archaeon]|jgi:hypothetical protein|nr:MAG: hypothetical protein JSV67_03505 [Thermoplasmatales archaeon]